jgi:hypothetical protein
MRPCDGFPFWLRRRDNLVSLFTAVLINVPCGIFLGYQWKFVLNISWFLFLIFAYLYGMSMSSFLCTVFTDPGFLPPGLDSVAAAGGRNEGGGGNGTFETHDQRNLLDASYPFSSELPQIQNKDVLIHGFSFRLKYCETCKIFRPPRCSHCSVCDRCVDNHDHHCPWMGNCIGKRNYRFFVSFLFWVVLLCAFVFGLSLAYLVTTATSKGLTVAEILSNFGPSIFLLVFTFLIMWLVGGLLVMHLYLIAKNLTTHEHVSFILTITDSFRYDYRSYWSLLIVFFILVAGTIIVSF